MPMVLFLLVLLAFPQFCGAQDVPYSAIVMAVKGKAVVRHNGKRMPADLGYLLYPGDEVTTAKSASLTVNYLESGGEEQWPGEKKFVVGKNGSRPAVSGMKRTEKKIVLPQIEYQQTGSVRLRGSGDPVRVNGLSNTCTIEDRPAFRWTPVAAADQYRVTLHRELVDEPLWQRVTGDTEMPYPKEEPSLNFGSRYEWQIEALSKGTVIAAKRSCFFLPARSDLDLIRDRVKGSRARLSIDPADSASRLALIFFLEQHHLYDDAIAEHQALRGLHGESGSMRKREESLLLIRSSDSNCSWPRQ